MRTHQHHGGEEEDNGKRFAEDHFQGLHDAPFDLLHVVGHARHDVAFSFVGEIRERQYQDFPIQLVAQIAHHAGTDRRHEVHAEVAEQVLQQEHHHDQSRDHTQGFELTVLGHILAEVIVEIVEQDLHRKSPGHLGISLTLTEEYVQKGRYHCQRKERKDHRQHVAQDVQQCIRFVPGDQPQEPKVVFHGAG